MRSSISNKIVELDRLRRQARDSRAPVNSDQQFVGWLSRMHAIQENKMSTANYARRQNRHPALLALFNGLMMEIVAIVTNAIKPLAQID